MTSQPRVDFDGAWHHVMNRGHNQQDIFRSDEDCESFCQALNDVTGDGGIEVHSYALMSNHYHLLVHTPTAGLGDAMQYLGATYAVRFNRKYGYQGAAFKGRYRSVLLDSEPHFLEVSRYIENNPVKAGIVSNPADYRWSSYRVVALDEPAPEFLSTNVIIPNYFGGSPLAYQAFVQRADSAAGVDYAASIERQSTDVALTDALDEYRDAMAALPTAGPLEVIERFVSLRLDVPRHLLRRRQRGQSQLATAVAMAIAYRLDIASPTELAAEYGYTSRAGVTSAIRRLEQSALSDPKLAAIMCAGLQLPIRPAA